VFRRSVLTGMAYLLAETVYQPDPENWRSAIPYAEAPWIRMFAVELAVALRDSGSGTDAVVQSWLDASLKDPLSIVRRAVEATG
jgi:hypothetical protein